MGPFIFIFNATKIILFALFIPAAIIMVPMWFISVTLGHVYDDILG